MLFESLFYKNYLFYASYHRDPINKAIHLVCVWPILITAIYLLTQTGPVCDCCKDFHGIELDWAAYISAAYILFFLLIEQPGICGVTAAALVGSSLWWANSFAQESGNLFWKEATAVHVFCWVAQFYGHAKHEGRAPALFDNLLQAFAFAPLFVLLEVFFFFGYKKDLENSVEKAIHTAAKKGK